MGFIQQSATAIGDTSQMVISLWFRITQADIDAAVDQWNAAVSGGILQDGILPGIIPLFTFGVPVSVDGAAYDSVSRCFVGIDCGHVFPPDQGEIDFPPPRMRVGLQHDTDSLETFYIGGSILAQGHGSTALEDGQFITVTPDAWHHILVSFDLSDGCTTSFPGPGDQHWGFDGGCLFYWAFDGVNYNGEYLWPSNPNNYENTTGPANEIYSIGCVTSHGDPVVNGGSYTAGPLPISGNPIGIPASSEDVSHVYNVVMAEIQVFTEVTLDTSDSENLAAFITEEGRPASPSLAAALLGKSPEIYFRSHVDWINGQNRGTGDDFTSTGTINPYSPGP